MMFDIVSSYSESGLSVIPTDPVGKNPRIPSWSKYQEERPTPQEISKWFGVDQRCSPGIITGKISGNLEILDFDEKARQFQSWCELVNEQIPGLVAKLVQQKTQSGGLHIAYRCPGIIIPGNQKLSMGTIRVNGPGEHQHDGKGYKAIQYRNKWVICPTLVETRGTGGYFLAAPGKGYELITGSFTKIPEITIKERDILIKCAEILNEYIQEQPAHQPSQPHLNSQQERPGDDYNARTTIQSLLTADGWRASERTKSLPDGTQAELWIRPGKQKGISATAYDNKVHIFSSNIPPLEQRVTYDPFSYIATSQFGGDFQRAASELAKQGYGRGDSGDSGDSGYTRRQGGDRGGDTSNKDLQNSPDKPRNYADDIRAFLSNYKGSFKNSDIDAEFNYRTRPEKQGRSKILTRLEKEGKIKKLPGSLGNWRTVDTTVKPMKRSGQGIKPFTLPFPLGIQDLVSIFGGNIITIAGETGAGKTGFCFKTVANIVATSLKKLESKYSNNQVATHLPDGNDHLALLLKNGIHYFNSEMHEAEVVEWEHSLDINLLDNPHLSIYEDVRYGWEDLVQPNGINIIDYIELYDNFYNVGQIISDIESALDKGIAIICLQKSPGKELGLGGQFSAWKARLVITLSLAKAKVRVAKLQKIKTPKDRRKNYEGMEIDFLVSPAGDFHSLTEWRYVNEKQRAAINKNYQANPPLMPFKKETDEVFGEVE